MNICPACGTRFDQNATFCPACGTPLPMSQQTIGATPGTVSATSVSATNPLTLAPLTRIRNLLAGVSAGSLALWVLLNFIGDIVYNGTRTAEYGTAAYYAAFDMSTNINLLAAALSYVVSAAFTALLVSIVLIAYRKTLR